MSLISLIFTRLKSRSVQSFGETALFQELFFQGRQLAIEQIIGLSNQTNQAICGAFPGAKISLISLIGPIRLDVAVGKSYPEIKGDGGRLVGSQFPVAAVRRDQFTTHQLTFSAAGVGWPSSMVNRPGPLILAPSSAGRSAVTNTLELAVTAVE